MLTCRNSAIRILKPFSLSHFSSRGSDETASTITYLGALGVEVNKGMFKEVPFFFKVFFFAMC